jgi:hypothetical protein
VLIHISITPELGNDEIMELLTKYDPVFEAFMLTHPLGFTYDG